MAKPITYHTVESLLAKTVEVGDCLEWQGYYATDKYVPYVCHGGKMQAVRKVLCELTGRETPSGKVFFGVSCGNWRCVTPEHIVARQSHQHMNRMTKQSVKVAQAPARKAKLQAAARKRDNCKIKDEAMIDAIKADPRSCKAVADELGVSKTVVARYRRGTSGVSRDARINPWAGLLR